ncbi:hypothetical protein Tco_1249536 [Tanacetum coccineum]
MSIWTMLWRRPHNSNETSTGYHTKEELRSKGIKSPSKLLPSKYQSQSSVIKQNKNPSSPKRVNFINSIVILNKEDEAEEEGTVEPSKTEYTNCKNANETDKDVESEKEIEEETKEGTKEEEEDEQEREGNPKDTNTIVYIKERRDIPLMEQKDITTVGNFGSNKDDEGIEWLDVEEPLDLVDTSEESVYESLIKEMPKCSLNYDFRIKKGDSRNLKIPYMIGHKFTANAYIDADLPINIMSLAYYNSIRKNGYEYRGTNFVRLGRDMHAFVGNMSYVIDFTILENIETNIDHSLLVAVKQI